MWPLSPRWSDPLAPGAGGRVFKSRAGVRIRELGNGDSTLLFIHGLGASLRYWGTAFDRLAEKRRLVFIDLLGFGGSDKPADVAYDLDFHATMVEDSLEEMGAGEVTAIGHSTGAAIALRLATASNVCRSVIAFGAPIFPSQDEARRYLATLGPLARSMSEGSDLARQMCRFMCEHRELSRTMAPLFVPGLPAGVASDGVDHTWESFSKTFESLVRDFDAASWIRELGRDLLLVYGSKDRAAPAREAMVTLGAANSRIQVVPGDHHLPLKDPRRCVSLILAGTTT